MAFLVRPPAQVNVNLADRKGLTPLHIACKADDPTLVQCLLTAGADKTARTLTDNLKPVFFADTEAVRRLFISGRSDELLDAAGRDPARVQVLLKEGAFTRGGFLGGLPGKRGPCALPPPSLPRCPCPCPSAGGQLKRWRLRRPTIFFSTAVSFEHVGHVGVHWFA